MKIIPGKYQSLLSKLFQAAISAEREQQGQKSGRSSDPDSDGPRSPGVRLNIVEPNHRPSIIDTPSPDGSLTSPDGSPDDSKLRIANVCKGLTG